MNKAQILKLTGLTENAFYKLYPSKKAWDDELKKSQDSYKFGGPIRKYEVGGGMGVGAGISTGLNIVTGIVDETVPDVVSPSGVPREKVGVTALKRGTQGMSAGLALAPFTGGLSLLLGPLGAAAGAIEGAVNKKKHQEAENAKTVAVSGETQDIQVPPVGTNFNNPALNLGMKYKNGGPMLTQKYGQGGTIFKNIMDLQGDKHSTPTAPTTKDGIPLGKDKLVEDKEIVIKDTSLGDYVASNSLFIDGKSHADMIRKVLNKPVNKLRPHDTTISGPAMTEELTKLVTNVFEPHRNSLGLGEPSQMKYGGKMKYWAGGTYNALTGKWEYTPLPGVGTGFSDEQMNMYNPDISAYKFQAPIHNKNYSYENEFIPPTATGTLDNRDFGTKPFDRIPTKFEQMGINFDPATQRFTGPSYSMNVPAVTSKGPTSVSTLDIQPKQPTNWSNVLGTAGNLAGGLAKIGYSFKKPAKVVAHQVTPATVDTYGRESSILNRDADLATNNLKAGLKGTGLGKAAFLSNLGQGITGIQNNLGTLKTKLRTQDELTNANFLQAARSQNANTNMQAQEYRQREADMKDTALLAGINDVGTAMAGMNKDKNSAKLDKTKYFQALAHYKDIFGMEAPDSFKKDYLLKYS